MSSAARRLAALEVIARGRQPDEPPTRCFFAIDRFQAAANYGNQPPDVVLAAVADVDRIIAGFDELRREHHLDLVEFAVMLSHARNEDPVAQTPSGLAGMLVQAYFHWDLERYGEDRAWRLQRSRGEFEHLVPGAIARLEAGPPA